MKTSFKNQTTEQKRVSIAKLALQMLLSGLLIAIHGTYLNIVSKDGELTKDKFKKGNNTTLSKLILLSNNFTDVLGSLYVALGRRLKLKWNGSTNMSFKEVTEKLAMLFDIKTLVLSEAAYEGLSSQQLIYKLSDNNIFPTVGELNEMEKQLAEYQYALTDFPTAQDKVKAILENIIRNNGEFLLTDLPDQYTKQVEESSDITDDNNNII